MSNAYMLTQRGTLMPCTTEGVSPAEHLVEVTSPNGTTYTPQTCHLVSESEGAHMLRERRGEKLVSEGYQIMHLRGDRYRVWSQKRHGDGGYIVTLGVSPSCTCPDAKTQECKHVMGAPDLLRRAQVQKPTVRVAATVNEGRNPSLRSKAVTIGIQPHSARMAAMIARDGWGD